MRINEPFKRSGYFWEPGKPDKKVPGFLSLSDGGYMELETIGFFDESPNGINKALNGKIKLDRINGSIEKGGYVTLDKCFIKNQYISSHGVYKLLIFVGRAIIGTVFDNNENLLFNTFQFSVEGIDEWVGVSGIKTDFSLKEQTCSILYSKPSAVSFNLNKNINFSIVFSWSMPAFGSVKKGEIVQKVYFILTCDQGLPLKDFISLAHNITNFLCFAIDETVCIDGISITADSLLQNVGDGKTIPLEMSVYYQSLPYSKKIPKIDSHKMLFRFSDIKDDIDQIIINWLGAYNDIRPALNLYFAVKTGAHKYIDSNFLSLAQCLESYHRRTSCKKLMKDVTFKNLTDDLLSHCPDDRREWLASRLQHGNELTLARRIQDIIEPFKEYFGSEKERKKLIRKIVDTRNYLTHYDESLLKLAATDRKLIVLNLRMEAIFQLHLLRVLGLTDDEIKSVYNDSRVLQHKLTYT